MVLTVDAGNCIKWLVDGYEVDVDLIPFHNHVLLELLVPL